MSAIPKLHAGEACFQQFFLPCEKEIVSIQNEDLNGDDRQDILLFYVDEEAHARWCDLYFQNENGFNAMPTQTFHIPEDVSLFDFGDIDPHVGREFLTFAHGALFYHTLSDSGISQERKRFLETKSLFIYPDRSRIRAWNFARDFNNDGADDIFIPKFDGAALWLHDAPTNTWRENDLQLLPQSRTFAYFDPRFSVGDKAGALFEVPYMLVDDFNNDALTDIIAIYKDSINVFAQQANRQFAPQPSYVLPINHGDIWNGSKIMRTHLDDKNERQFLIRLVDIDGDGVLDIVTSSISTKHSLINPETTTSVFLGRKSEEKGYYFTEEVDYIIEPDGTQMVIDIRDFNRDGRQAFIIPTIKIGATSIIKMLLTRSIDFDAQLFLFQSGRGYSKEAQRKISMNVNFSFRGGAASPIYEIADFNGDGLLDVLASADEEMLLIYYGDKKRTINSTPGARYKIILPQDGTLVKAEDLNNDGRADIILNYEPGKLQMAGMSNGLFVLLGCRDE